LPFQISIGRNSALQIVGGQKQLFVDNAEEILIPVVNKHRAFSFILPARVVSIKLDTASGQ